MIDKKEQDWSEAQRILSELQITKITIPVERVAKKLGAKIRYSPMDNEDLSGMVFIKDGIPIIGINSLHHPNRQRFTIAHEIGHLVLHRKIIENGVHVDTTFFGLKRDQKSIEVNDTLEIEANNFASELLIPADLIEGVIDSLVGDQVIDIETSEILEQLATKFKVSRDAMQYRLMRLMA